MYQIMNTSSFKHQMTHTNGTLVKHSNGSIGRILERRGKSKRKKVLVETTTGLKVEWFIDKCAQIVSGDTNEHDIKV